MATIFDIHPQNPQSRLINQVASLLRGGNIGAIPTDSCYSLVCHLDDKDAVERIRRIRALPKDHHFTLLCRDLSELGKFARVTTPHYRLLKAHTPGAYSFILSATAEVPRRFCHPKRKTIGMRVPDNTVCQSVLTALNEPLLSVTLILPDASLLTNADDINELLGRQLDFIIGGSITGSEPTTVIDLTEARPEILRIGKGDPAPFEV